MTFDLADIGGSLCNLLDNFIGLNKATKRTDEARDLTSLCSEKPAPGHFPASWEFARRGLFAAVQQQRLSTEELAFSGMSAHQKKTMRDIGRLHRVRCEWRALKMACNCVFDDSAMTRAVRIRS